MKIHNIRFGLATNSSSTHSLIYMNDDINLKDEHCENGDFGWQYFTATSQEVKNKYLFSYLHDALNRTVPEVVIRALAKEWLPNLDMNYSYTYDYGIDHQSQHVLPLDASTNFIHEEFFEDFRDFILNEKLAILGGNDNDEETHPSLDDGELVNLKIPQDDNSKNWYARKDYLNNSWTLFNKLSGTKVRFSFDKNATDVVKSTCPELIDLSITDWCPFGCTFCYKNSTLDGKHADFDLIKTMVANFAKMQVFEVAIGGGEPTMHPKFKEILHEFKRNNIVANFTTKNLAWLKSEDRERILNNCGGFAYSASSASDVKDLAALARVYDIENYRYSVHIVDTTVDSYNEIEKILLECYNSGIRATLLGFKTNGRGQTYIDNMPAYRRKKPVSIFNIIDKLQANHKLPSISVDTLFIQNYENELKERKIPGVLYYKNEGHFSCYVDAVSGKLGPSSYCPSEEMVKIDWKKETIESFLEQYARY